MRKVEDVIKRLSETKQDALSAFPAKLGDGTGKVIAGAGLVYVRIANMISVAACTNIPPVTDLDVWVGYDPLQRNVLRVLGQREAIGNREYAPGVAAHAAMHEFLGDGPLGGTDVIKVRLQQFMPLAVLPYDNNMRVIVYPGVVWLNGEYKLIGDINSYGKPVPKIIDFGEYYSPDDGKEMFYLIGIDYEGKIQVIAGNQKDIGQLTLADIPETTNTIIYHLAAVRRVRNMGIVINRESSDIVDLRFPMPHTHTVFTQNRHGFVPAPGNALGRVLLDTGEWGYVSSGSGGIDFYVDGVLAVVNGAAYYIVPKDMQIGDVYVYCQTSGTAGSTIIDIKRNGTSIFTTLPEVAYNAPIGMISATPSVSDFQAGDRLRLDIVQTAEGAANLAVAISGSVSGGGGGGEGSKIIASGMATWTVNAGEYVYQIDLSSYNITDDMNDLHPLANVRENAYGLSNAGNGDWWTVMEVGFYRSDGSTSGPPHYLEARVRRLVGNVSGYTLRLYWSVLRK